MPFALHEYDEGFSRFFSETVRMLARAGSPLLSQVEFMEVSGTVGSRVRDREGMDVELEPDGVSMDVTADLKAIRAADFAVLHTAMFDASKQLAEGLVGAMVESMRKVTEGTGNVVDAGGQELSFEMVFEMLEKLDFSLDENDELVLPSLLMNPDQQARLLELGPPTPDQEQKMAELRARKWEEALARRRRRRLS